jgi:ATP-binding cassette subfamily B protein
MMEKQNSTAKQSHLAWLWDAWRSRKGLIGLLFLLTILSSAVSVTYPYLSKLLIDMLQRLLESKAGADVARLETTRLALIVLGVGFAGFIANLYPGIRGAANIVFEYSIRSKFFRKVMEKDHRFHAAFRTGDITTRLTDDINNDGQKLSWFMCSGIFRAIDAFGKIAFCLGAMFLINWKLTLLSLIPLPLTIVVFSIAQDRIYDTFRKNQEAISDINNQLEMSFSGVRIIKAYASERKYERFFQEALARRFGTEMALNRLGIVLMMIYQYIDYVAQIGIIFAGGYMAVKGTITIGTFYAFYNYLGMLIYPILDIPTLFVSGKRAFVNIDRLEEMAAFPDPPRQIAPMRIEGVERVEALNLAFSYEGRKEAALSDVSFRLEKGERLAVIGPVGSGKTTLVKALAGLLPPASGEIRLNGRPFDMIDRHSYAQTLGYVPQDPLLFSGKIRENIAFGTRGDGNSIGDEELGAALGTAQIAAEVAAFQDGCDTLLGQRGIAVSGGQKQRLAIARAVARKPSLLLLDDITASLDAANEERLWRSLEDAFGDLTCIVVSHRLSTLHYADKVLFLDGGRALAFGRHEELVHENPVYRSFIEEHLAAGATN